MNRAWIGLEKAPAGTLKGRLHRYPFSIPENACSLLHTIDFSLFLFLDCVRSMERCYLFQFRVAAVIGSKAFRDIFEVCF